MGLQLLKDKSNIQLPPATGRLFAYAMLSLHVHAYNLHMQLSLDTGISQLPCCEPTQLAACKATCCPPSRTQEPKEAQIPPTVTSPSHTHTKKNPPPFLTELKTSIPHPSSWPNSAGSLTPTSGTQRAAQGIRKAHPTEI